ncbi:MAG: TolC family protein [Mariprofundaceae bacterium]|nr:TolC family protein [Mariprofundaceae bacterium]
MITRIVPWLICVLFSFPAIAEEVSLARVVELAIEHAPAMQSAEAGRDAAQEDLTIGRAALLPRIDVSGNYQWRDQRVNYDTNQNIFQPDYKSRDSSVSLRMVQPLFDLERWAGYRQGEISGETGEMRVRLERQRLMLETAQVYLEAVTAASALKASKAKEQAAEQLAAQAQALFESGVSAVNDRLDADARSDLAIAERLAAENTLDQALSTLASLTGSDALELSPPAIVSPIATPLPEPGQWEDLAAESALTTRLARLQFRSAEEEKMKVVGSNLPKVEAFASIQGTRATSGQLGIGSKSRDRAVGLQFSMPVFSGGGDRAQLKKSQKELLQAQFALEDDIRLARLTARQALLGYSAALLQLHAMQQAVVSAREAAGAARMGHEVGLRTITELLDADERRFAAEKSLAEARAGLVFAELQIYASIGALDSGALPEVFGSGFHARGHNGPGLSGQ